MFELPSRSTKRRETAVRKPVPNYLSRREQWRLFVLVGSLMLVIILMVEASKPKNWQWLWAHAQSTNGPAEAEIPSRDIDTRLSPAPHRDTITEPDVFMSPADEPPPADADQTAEEGYFPGVKPELLSAVRDDMLLLPSEYDAWYHLLAVLQNADEEDLEKASLGRVGFVQLFEQSKEYRGRLVTVKGTVRRAHQVLAPTNDYGIKGYWIIWLWPAGAADFPIMVYSLQMPEGFPQGMKLNEEAVFTGFSYKRKAYQAAGRTSGGETRTAPLVMAKIGQWTPPPPPEEDRPVQLWTILAAVGGTALLAAGLALFVYLRSSSVSPAAEQHSTRGKAAPGALEALKQTDLGPDVREKLDRMASQGDPLEEE